MNGLQGRAALVTGGAVGIGRATALALAREGADVAVHYHAHEADARDVGRTIEALGPLGRAGEPEDVAKVIAFLAGEGASFLVGETIDINGGMFTR